MKFFANPTLSPYLWRQRVQNMCIFYYILQYAGYGSECLRIVFVLYSSIELGFMKSTTDDNMLAVKTDILEKLNAYNSNSRHRIQILSLPGM